MILIDLKSAFDTAWHDAIIHKMIRAGFSTYLIRLIHSFLSQRQFKVKVGSKFSNLKYPKAGVPQGPVLSPILFNILVSDMPTPNDC